MVGSSARPYGSFMAQETAHALVAHVIRRLTFSPTPDLIERFANGAATPEAAAKAAVEWALEAAPLPLNPATLPADGWDPALRGWVDNMRNPDAGLHEKMTFFWHGYFATSSEKVGNQSILHSQQGLFRKHALGNFGTLLREITTDPGMLLYLDGAGSNVQAPNENYAREVMELFTLGRGNYTEADVKAGALALAGWQVEYESGKVTFDAAQALGGEIVFLGRRGRLNVDDVVATLLNHPKSAPFVASKIYAYIVGQPPSEDRAAELGDVFRSAKFEIKPLLQHITSSPDFLGSRMNRPRYPIEWFIATVGALGEPREGEDPDIGPWTLKELDQLPFNPPNVAGWPSGPKWLSASQQLARASYAWGQSWKMKPLDGTNLVAAVMKRCGIHECSDATKAALRDAATATAGSADALSVSRRLISAALLSPEFALA
jgi:uncharacterized protein (DUF1800 family)